MALNVGLDTAQPAGHLAVTTRPGVRPASEAGARLRRRPQNTPRDAGPERASPLPKGHPRARVRQHSGRGRPRGRGPPRASEAGDRAHLPASRPGAGRGRARARVEGRQRPGARRRLLPDRAPGGRRRNMSGRKRPGPPQPFGFRARNPGSVARAKQSPSSGGRARSRHAEPRRASRGTRARVGGRLGARALVGAHPEGPRRRPGKPPDRWRLRAGLGRRSGSGSR